MRTAALRYRFRQHRVICSNAIYDTRVVYKGSISRSFPPRLAITEEMVAGIAQLQIEALREDLWTE